MTAGEIIGLVSVGLIVAGCVWYLAISIVTYWDGRRRRAFDRAIRRSDQIAEVAWRRIRGLS